MNSLSVLHMDHVSNQTLVLVRPVSLDNNVKSRQNHPVLQLLHPIIQSVQDMESVTRLILVYVMLDILDKNVMSLYHCHQLLLHHSLPQPSH